MTGGVMTIWKRFGVALVAPILLWSGAALGQTKTPPARTPQTVEGQVVKIDRSQGRVTIRATDGTTHEFQASAETLQDLKEGDRIEARLRPQ
jgi:Cu/Ag efflux protein CusF